MKILVGKIHYFDLIPPQHPRPLPIRRLNAITVTVYEIVTAAYNRRFIATPSGKRRRALWKSLTARHSFGDGIRMCPPPPGISGFRCRGIRSLPRTVFARDTIRDVHNDDDTEFYRPTRWTDVILKVSPTEDARSHGRRSISWARRTVWTRDGRVSPYKRRVVRSTGATRKKSWTDFAFGNTNEVENFLIWKRYEL